MVQVLLSFDTEDYTAPYADDAILRLVDILDEEGITGCFNMVGELCRALAGRNRRDVIEALKRHEINYHSLNHTWHPTIAEYCDTDDWHAAYERFMKTESQGVAIVKETFGVDTLWASVPPGNCMSAQSIHGYAELGIPICSGSLFKGTAGKGIWYCNALNLENNGYIDDLLLTEGLDGVKHRLDVWKQWDRLILCCHPNIIHYEQFWDAVNMKGANLVPWGQWLLPARRPKETSERFYADFRAMLRLFKQDADFVFVTNRDIWREQRAVTRSISKPQLIQLLEAVNGRFFYQIWEGNSFSLAEIFGATIHYLSGAQQVYTTESMLGPLEAPVGVGEPVLLQAADVVAVAGALAGSRVVPSSISAGGFGIGPGDLLKAARQVFSGSDQVRIAPSPQLPDMQSFYKMNDFKLANTWMYPASFADNWVTKRLKLQSWTIRPE